MVAASDVARKPTKRNFAGAPHLFVKFCKGIDMAELHIDAFVIELEALIAKYRKSNVNDADIVTVLIDAGDEEFLEATMQNHFRKLVNGGTQ